ncbi:MAG: endonuclease MutS2 [Thermomicrobiales bacterium]
MPIAASILDTLEYPKVLARLARACDYSLARERAEALRPETAVPPVRRMLAETSEARMLLASNPEVGVGGARDVREPVRLSALGVTLNPAQLLDIRDTAVAARTLRRTITRLEDASQRFPVILDHAAALGDFTNLDATITAAISPRGDVLDSASDELRRIRIAVRTAQSRLMEYMNGFIRGSRAAALQEPIITERSGRYVVPVRADQKASVPGIVHDTSASGQTLFVEPMEAVEMNNRWRTLQIEEEREIERILQALTAFVAKEADALERAMAGLAAIDFALAKARLAAEMRANPPRLWTADDAPKQSPEGAHPTLRLDLVAGRHPLLTGEVVPTDISLGDRFRILVITGPNTGGKTVALKTVALLAMMTQSGLHIPADEHTIMPVFESIFADIGDEQSIEQSLSTFSSHMTRVIATLRDVTPESLVLLDELGAGTDPEEGSALARALIATLLERGPLVIATTHYSELKSYAYMTPGVENGSVEFDVETLSPTYHLTVGVPGRSNALAIAQRLGLDPQVIERARQYVAPEVVQVDTLLEGIKGEREAAERARSRASRERAQAEQMKRDAAKALYEAEKAKASARAEGLAEIERELSDLRADLRRLSRERDTVSVTRDWIKQAEQRALETQQQLKESVAQEATAPRPAPPILANLPADGPDRPLQAGDRVLVPAFGDSEGLITVLYPASGEADVQVGSFTMRQPLIGLTRLSNREAARRATLRGERPRAARPAPVSVPAPSANASLEVDLRGMRAVEIDRVLDRALNDAVLASMPYLRIIHGKGTGALRQVVRDYLRASPLVVGAETAPDQQGGDGVTIARLSEG